MKSLLLAKNGQLLAVLVLGAGVGAYGVSQFGERPGCPGRIVCPLTGEVVCRDRCPLGATEATADSESELPPCCRNRASSARAEDNETSPRNTSPDRVSLFQVPLQCPSAPEIGCGSKARRILPALERHSSITEAWLNKAGTVLAVVGAENSTPEARARAVQSILEKRNATATELEGVAREKLIKDFESRAGWFRGDEVDQLSKQEAGIIAARLVRRLRANVSLSDDKARTLEAAFTDVFTRHYTRDLDKPDQARPNDELFELAGEHLDEKGTAALKDALAAGLRPLPNEE